MRTVLALSCLILISGCGRSSGRAHSETAPVSGKLTLAGAPLQKGTQVVISNEDDGFVFSGTTDEAGAFKIISQFPENGVPIGHYVVTIAPPAAPQVNSMELALNPKANQVKIDFPKSYMQTKTSGLDFEVQLKDNVLDLDLKKK
ncbi:carboxypeptidase-like regulatory domain-containing protein [Planctomicrobium sp. SH661]|uniref:carboxypeptidase-like regulatory domain-containing protein n=1 Tax=Planctomicrobium sp. SH661 TaxID=3448124 RepID=UPI003F5B0B45